MILITTYHNNDGDERFSNRRQYLEETIASVDRQESNDIFHLIIDDGSTDDMYIVLSQKYANHPTRRVVRREKTANEPMSSTNARNYALSLVLNNASIDGVDITKHNYISFIDSDDVVMNLNRRLQLLESSKCAFGYSDAVVFFDDSEQAFLWCGMDPMHAYKNFWVQGRMPYPTITWRKDFLVKLKSWVKDRYGFEGPFNPFIGCGEDVDVALSSFECAAFLNEGAEYLQEVTAGYRIHNYSLASVRSKVRRGREEMKVLTQHLGFWGAIFAHTQRFFVRPECYFPILMNIKNLFREKRSKSLLTQ